MPSSSPSGVANTKPVSSKVKEPFSSRLLSVLSLVVGVRGQVFGLTTGMVREFLAFKAFLSPGWRKAKLRLERKRIVRSPSSRIRLLRGESVYYIIE